MDATKMNMKKLIERKGCIWFEYNHGADRVYVDLDYWVDQLKFWEWCLLELINRFTKYRLTIKLK